MPNIIQINLKNTDGKWSYGVIKDDTYTEKTTENVKGIQEHIDALVLFSETIKSEEEKKAEELESKNKEIIDKVISIIPEENLEQVKDIFDDYVVGKKYIIGNIFRYNDFLYKVIQSHTSQNDWMPGTPGTASLYIQVGKKDEIFEFGKNPDGSQRILAVNPYNYNEKCTWEGFVWNSIISNNVWSPTEYPQGWEKEREVI